jgi:hypothetical protein
MSVRLGVSTAVLLLAGSLACAVPATAARQSSVAVVSCPTSYGIKQRPPALPKRLSVAASQSATKQLAAYTNGVLILLGPRDWHCHALVGADGSADMTIAAGSTIRVSQPAITENFASTPGDASSLACALFPAAASQLPSGEHCSRQKPPREATSTINSHTLAFADPRRVHGDGVPSGGSDAARGVMAFVPAGSGFAGFAFTATCTLPSSARGICTTVLHDALTRIPADE